VKIYNFKISLKEIGSLLPSNSLKPLKIRGFLKLANANEFKEYLLIVTNK
jgi:hypothetical protein